VWKTGVRSETYVVHGFPEKLQLVLGHGTNLQIKTRSNNVANDENNPD
jgi:hypothetical protein